MAVLGKFAVIMADPPWDIHMELPYGEKYFPLFRLNCVYIIGVCTDTYVIYPGFFQKLMSLQITLNLPNKSINAS